MLVSRLHEFIKTMISIERQLSAIDKELLHLMWEKYPLVERGSYSSSSLPNSNDLLTEEDIQWLQENLAKRWQKIFDKKDEDYTFEPGGNNKIWIDLAKDLAAELKKPYLLILIPSIENKQDPDLFSYCEQDPSFIYLADDNQTWHRVQGLIDRMQQPLAVFSTYDSKKIKPRALTLKEMYRIRSKKGEELLRQMGVEGYVSFWDYIIKKIAPTWQEKGSCPEVILPILLELIEQYFESGCPNDKFYNTLELLTKELRFCSLEDVNYLYGIKIYDNKNNYYLIDILLDCFTKEKNIGKKLASVARWLCHFDPALVSKAKQLISVYEESKVGKYFDIEQLKQLLSLLPCEGNLELESDIHHLIEDMAKATVISAEMITRIKQIYAFRWQVIKDCPEDYLRRKNQQNCPWIRLAQYLAGAEYIKSNYYQLLIPSLRYDIDLITQEPLMNYPLSYFILSEDEAQLFYLPNIIKYHQVNGLFYCLPYETRPRTLTPRELKRLTFAAPQFQEYYLQVTTEEENFPLSRETINAIKELVNGTLNPKALRLGYEITEDQAAVAEKAYIKFFDYISNLPADEAGRLFKHGIIWRGRKKTVAEILTAIQKDKKDIQQRECIAIAGQFFAKLVIDYDPAVEFQKNIEEDSLVALDEMRLCSAKHVFRNWDHIDEKEAIRRALILVVSLMTHSFSYLWFTGVSLNFYNFTNTTTETGRELFKSLELALEFGDVKRIRFLYTYVINNIVGKALSQNAFIKKCTRYEDTLHWLKNIKDESIFDKKNSLCFDPKLIFIILMSFSKKAKIKSTIEKWLKDIIQTMQQPYNDYICWIIINIKFNNLLKQGMLSEKYQQEILGALRERVEPVEDSEFISVLGIFLVEQVAATSAYASSRTNAQGLLGINPGVYTHRFNEFKEKLINGMTKFMSSMLVQKEKIIEQLFDFLNNVINQVGDKHINILTVGLAKLRTQLILKEEKKHQASFRAL